MIGNILVMEIYGKWLSLCAINEGSMANIYDFQALDFIFNNYGLEQDEKEECIDKISIISKTLQEMNKSGREVQERIDKKFKNKAQIKNKYGKGR